MNSLHQLIRVVGSLEFPCNLCEIGALAPQGKAHSFAVAFSIRDFTVYDSRFFGGHKQLLITCFLRYWIDPDKLDDFEHYARVWMRLIEKYGGTHLGYFVPDKQAPPATFSFPGIGEPGPDNVGVALFSFPTLEAYDAYRRDVRNDPECVNVTAHFERTKCFTKYERTFVKRVAA